MRILQLIQRPQFRGTEVFASQLAHVHRQEGHDVRLLALFPARGGEPFLDNGNPIELLGANPGRRLLDRKGWKRLADRIKAFRPDIVQANAADTLKYAVFSRLTYGWRVPLVYRNASVTSQWIKSPVHAAYNKWLLKRVDAIACVSQASRRDLHQYFGIPEDRLVILPNATILPEKLDRASAQQRIFAEFSLPGEADLLLHVGAFTAEKNQLGLLEIFKELLDRSDRKIFLLFAGDGPLKEIAEARAEELGLTEQVRFPGNRSDVPDLLQAATLLLLPSKIEGLPGVILEAMAHRTPIVASPVGGIPEVIEDGITGLLAFHDQPGDFSNQVLVLLTNPQMRNRIVTNSVDKVKTNYSIEVAAQGFSLLYQKLKSGLLF
jgi:glycosyltransferase involved in cell wall biosynthesis